MRAKCYVWCASEDSGRTKIGTRAKKGKEQGEGGAVRKRLQANPTILKNPFAHAASDWCGAVMLVDKYIKFT